MRFTVKQYLKYYIIYILWFVLAHLHIRWLGFELGTLSQEVRRTTKNLNCPQTENQAGKTRAKKLFYRFYFDRALRRDSRYT